MKETATDRIITHLKREYYGNLILLTGLFILVLLRSIPFPENIFEVSITLERYAILITLIAIPAALKLFSDRLKKAPRPMQPEEAAKKYKKLSRLRLYTISAVTLMNIVLFAFSRNTNFLWSTVVLLVVFLFCQPSYIELKSLSELSETGESEMEETQEEPKDGEVVGK